MDGAEVDRERGGHPAPRWRALLDRARGARPEDAPPDENDLTWLDPAAGWPERGSGGTYVSAAARHPLARLSEPTWEPPQQRLAAAPVEEWGPVDDEWDDHAVAPTERQGFEGARPAADGPDAEDPTADVADPTGARWPTDATWHRGDRSGWADDAGPPDWAAADPDHAAHSDHAVHTDRADHGDHAAHTDRADHGDRAAHSDRADHRDHGDHSDDPDHADFADPDDHGYPGPAGPVDPAGHGAPPDWTRQPPAAGYPRLDVDPGALPGYGAALLADFGGELSFHAAGPHDADDPAVRLRRGFGGPRVIAFANPKGGVHKTTATVLAAATIGAVRGRGVVAWDDNELRGTLGLRAGSARHARTIRHLVAELERIEQAPPAALRSELDDYLRHAPDGSYDILAGEENPRFAQQLDAVTVQRVLDLLRRTHDVVCVDTGNNVQSANWQTVLRGCDQLVVTTVPREDAAFAADWMLDLLHEVGLGELADRSVTLVSSTTPERSALAEDLERHFATRTRAVVGVPYDPALEAGSSIDHHELRPETRAAWLRAAGAIMEPFTG